MASQEGCRLKSQSLLLRIVQCLVVSFGRSMYAQWLSTSLLSTLKNLRSVATLPHTRGDKRILRMGPGISDSWTCSHLFSLRAFQILSSGPLDQAELQISGILGTWLAYSPSLIAFSENSGTRGFASTLALGRLMTISNSSPSGISRSCWANAADSAFDSIPSSCACS